MAWRYRFRRPAAPDAAVPYEKLPYQVRYYMDGEEYNPKWRYSFGRGLAGAGRPRIDPVRRAAGKRLARDVQPDTRGRHGPLRPPAPPGERREIHLQMPTGP